MSILNTELPISEIFKPKGSLVSANSDTPTVKVKADVYGMNLIKPASLYLINSEVPAIVYRDRLLASSKTGKTVYVSKTSRRNVVCKYFLSGRCTKGDACPFYHPENVVAGKKSICRLFVTDTKHNSCTRAHSWVYLPCPFKYIDGNCTIQSCPYSHDDAILDADESIIPWIRDQLKSLSGPHVPVEWRPQQGVRKQRMK